MTAMLRAQRTAVVAFLLAILLVAFERPAYSSGPVGKIVGTVTDKSGASVSDAILTVTNQDTSENRTARTGSAGDFVFTVLPVGRYTVKVEKAGFQIYEQKNIILQVDQSVSVLPVLQPGSVTETVTVEASAEATVNLTDATISHVVDQQRVVDLPLNGRDALQLQFIMPGVTFDTDSTAHGQGQHEGVVVAGNRPGSNYYLLDGVDMTDAYLSVAPTFPAPDALREFSIQTSDYNAQYGRSSGAVVNAATNSGTNNWHGDLFEFFRNDKLNAHSYFDTKGLPVGHYRLNQFGGTIGGPVQKDKTFVFGYFQETRQRRSATQTISTLLTQQERPDLNASGNADFSDCGSTQIVCPLDPRTGALFPGNIIPANRIDPTALNFVKTLMPLPNNGVGYVFQQPSEYNLDDNNEPQAVVRVDHNFSQADSAFVRYYFNQDSASGTDGFPGAPHDKKFRNQNAAIEWTHTFSPTLLNNATFGFSRMSHSRGPTKSIGWDTLGGPTSGVVSGLPTDFFGGINGSLGGQGQGSFVQNRQTTQITDFVNLVKGKHAITVGAEYRKESVNRVEDFFSDPVFNFSGQYTSDGTPAHPGNALADLLLGLPNYFETDSEVRSELRHPAVNLYVADNYKVKRNVTLDVGLRWEPYLPPVDNLNDQICLDATFTKQSAYYPTAPVGILFPGPPVGQGSLGHGDPGCPRSGVPNRWANFAPRIGFNWDPTNSGKMSVRAGYGVFYDQVRLIGYNRFSTAEPYAAVVQRSSGQLLSAYQADNFQPMLTGNAVYTLTNLTNPFPFQAPRTPGERASFSPSYGGNWPTQALEVGLDPHFNEGYTQDWNLTIQRELGHDMSASAGYVGNRANHLWIAHAFNYFIPGTPGPARRFDGIACGTASPGITAPCYGSFEEESSQGWSTYNSLQLTLAKRMQHGLSFNASYVYGKYLDVFSFGAEGRNGPRDPFNWGLDYGPSDNDVRHRVVVTTLWQIPDAKRLHGAASAVLNHWQTNLIAIAQTGTPFTVYSNFDTAGYGIGLDTAVPVPGQAPNVGHRYYGGTNGTTLYYLNPAAYTDAPNGSFGGLGRNSFYGPGYVNFDFSLFKEFHLTEAQRLQFRSEFFNLFNHPNFSNPGNTVGGGLGVIGGVGSPRLVQFALKYLF
jgi:Carboxypeptidase regulatory-like domain